MHTECMHLFKDEALFGSLSKVFAGDENYFFLTVLT